MCLAVVVVVAEDFVGFVAFDGDSVGFGEISVVAVVVVAEFEGLLPLLVLSAEAEFVVVAEDFFAVGIEPDFVGHFVEFEISVVVFLAFEDAVAAAAAVVVAVQTAEMGVFVVAFAAFAKDVAAAAEDAAAVNAEFAVMHFDVEHSPAQETFVVDAETVAAAAAAAAVNTVAEIFLHNVWLDPVLEIALVEFWLEHFVDDECSVGDVAVECFVSVDENAVPCPLETDVAEAAFPAAAGDTFWVTLFQELSPLQKRFSVKSLLN